MSEILASIFTIGFILSLFLISCLIFVFCFAICFVFTMGATLLIKGSRYVDDDANAAVILASTFALMFFSLMLLTLILF